MGDPQTGKLYLRGLLTGVRLLSPRLGSPVLGSGTRRKSPESIWLWRLVGLECRSSIELGETETSLLKDAHRVFWALEPRGKSTVIWADAKPPHFSWKVPWRGGETLAHYGDKHTDVEVLGEGSLESWRLSWRLPFWGQAWSHPTDLRLQCWDVLGQKTNRAGTQPHISADIAP